MIVGTWTHPLTGINDAADCGVANLGRIAVEAAIGLRALAPDCLELLQLAAQGIDGLAGGHVGVFVRAVRLAGCGRHGSHRPATMHARSR